jgi:hypothetical protein
LGYAGHRGVHVGIRGGHDHRDVAVHLPDLLQDLRPGELGHHHVQHHQVVVGALEDIERLGRIRLRGDLVALLRQDQLEVLTVVRLVVDDQDSNLHGPPGCEPAARER